MWICYLELVKLGVISGFLSFSREDLEGKWEYVADELDKQLRIEENHDCSWQLETLRQTELMIVVCSLLLSVVEKNNGNVVAEVVVEENNENVVVAVVEGKQWKCGGGGGGGGTQ